jgi:hypothetical protein
VPDAARIAQPAHKPLVRALWHRTETGARVGVNARGHAQRATSPLG